MFNPDSIRGFCLPAGGFASQRGAVAQRAAIAEFIGGPKPALEPTAQAIETSSLEAFNAALTDLELRLGREAMSADDRTALESDPVARAAWLAKVEQVTSRSKAREAAAAEVTKAETEAAAVRERGRLSSLGLFAALAADRK
jgi:hypothetical protein